MQQRHGETITLWTCAKHQAADQIQDKGLYAYHDSIQNGGKEKEILYGPSP